MEIAPSAPYGLTEYFNKNLKYPRDAHEAGITGRVHVKFVINEDGHVSNVQVMQGLMPSLDAEAKRLVEQMPPWIPGTSNGKPVKVYFTMPVRFYFADDAEERRAKRKERRKK